MKGKKSSKKHEIDNETMPKWLNEDNLSFEFTYSDDDLAKFAEGFIKSNSDVPAVKNLIDQVGLKQAKEQIQKRMKNRRDIELLKKKLT